MSQLTSFIPITCKSILFCFIFSPWIASSDSVNYQLGVPMQDNYDSARRLNRGSAPHLQYSLPRTTRTQTRFSTGASVHQGLSYQPYGETPAPPLPVQQPTHSLLSRPMPMLGSVPQTTAQTSYYSGSQAQTLPVTPYHGIPSSQIQSTTTPADVYSAALPQPPSYAPGNIAHAVPTELSSDDDCSKDSSSDDSSSDSSDDCSKPSPNRQSSASNDWTIYHDGKVRRGRHHDVSHKAPVFSGSSCIHSQTALLLVVLAVTFLAA